MMRSESTSSCSTHDKEKTELVVRTRITRILEDRLSNSNKPSDQTTMAAKCLEQLLFQSASSFEIYQDLSTLDSRIRTVVAVKVQRRMQASSKKNRSQVLRKTLGRARYAKALELVREIQLSKNQKVATMKCTGGVCTRPFRQSFPPVVRNLFFETALMDAFERSPVEKIPPMDWDGLITNAEENLRAYHQWSN
jgi:hypothetical protein